MHKPTNYPHKVKLDWIEQCFTSPPTQYRIYGRRFKRPNQQYQSTEETNSTQTNHT